MYLRTTRRKNLDGSVVEYYQLAHNTWDKDKQRSNVEVLFNFGRADLHERDSLVRLCRSIARVCGVEVVDPTEAGDQAGAGPDPEALGIETVDAGCLGIPWVVDALWREFGIDRVLRSVLAEEGLTLPYERALFAIVANRLVEPASKLGVCERWLDTVHLPDAPSEWKKDWFYEAMDVLERHAAPVEEAVFYEVANLMNLAVDVFFDTTTASFAIDENDPDLLDEDGEVVEPGLRRFGHAKEGTWSPQVVIALAVTREGLPVRSWVLPGNTTDCTVVQRIREDLRGWRLNRVLMVGDAGMDSAENRAELARACGRYVLAVRSANLKEVREEVLSRPGRYKEVSENLRVKEVVVGEGEMRRRYLVCHNPAQAERQEKHREQVVREIEEEMARHRDAEAHRQWVAEIRASGRYGRYVKLDARGRLCIDRSAVQEAARMDGKWILVTNDDSLAPGDAAQAYKGLLVIERCFRDMKRVQIHLCPMYHWLERRIVAHVKLCVMALLLQRVAELRAGCSWMRIRHVLQGVRATEVRVGADRFLQSSRPSEEAAELMQKLKVQPPKKILAVLPSLETDPRG
jgi:transposase